MVCYSKSNINPNIGRRTSQNMIPIASISENIHSKTLFGYEFTGVLFSFTDCLSDAMNIDIISKIKNNTIDFIISPP